MSALDRGRLRSIKEYVGFDEESEALVRAFAPLAEPYFKGVVDDFYAVIDAHEEAREVITGGRQQTERLKRSLTDWLASLLSGNYDEQYLERHARIGRVHVRIGLPQYLMFTAMSRVREQLMKAVQQVYTEDVVTRGRVAVAVHQLLDIELAIMLDSYREDLIEKQRAHERLATIGELAASVGHELRNPLGTMESSLFLIARRLEKLGIADAQLKKHCDKATRQVGHCTDTISRLLDLARDRPPRFERVLLNALLRGVTETASFQEHVTIEVDVPEDLIVWGDPTQLSLMLGNLIRNASEASPERVCVRIEAREQKGGVVLIVGDDGPGIPDEIRPRVFEALFTTRSQGTGLGLALIARIVEAHCGEIALVTAAPGVPSTPGATFRIWLPAEPK